MPKNIHNYLIYIESYARFVIILQIFIRLMKIILFIYKKQKKNTFN